MTRIDVRLTRANGDAITPSHRDLFIVAKAGAAPPTPDVIKINNLGPNEITLAPPTIALGNCPSGLFAVPVLSGTVVGRGTEATVNVRINSQNQSALDCDATLTLSSTTAGAAAEPVPIKVKLKN
jgi:hypothetical protein